MFERPHHQRVADLLGVLDADLLRRCRCLFGGGTAMALRFGEYRESLGVDFLVSDAEGYRTLRQLLGGGEAGIAPLVRQGVPAPLLERALRADQYGIRTAIVVGGVAIKFEIVREARISLDDPKADDEICGVATLAAVDMAAGKLLANADRGQDDGTFNRDLIDLAMMAPRLPLLRRAVEKAESAYGNAIRADLARSLDRLRLREGWLERCMHTMAMRQPKAVVWQRLRSIARVLA